MLQFTTEDIDGQREDFRLKGYKEEQVDLGDDIRFSYFVIPQSEEPNLRDFVMRMTGKKLSDGQLFGVSDSVRKDFRPYATAHEFIEFVKIGLDTPNRCVSALEKELSLVPESIIPDYIRMRRDFFRNLVPYVQSQNDFYTPHDIGEFRKTLQKLEELAR